MEKRQPGKNRTIWNCSHQARRHDKGVIIDREGTRLPVAVNSAAALPPWMSFEWPTIGTECETIDITATGAVAEGQPVLLQTVDLEARLRMFAIASRELCKTFTHAVGRYRADDRMVMGRLIRPTAASAPRL